MAHYMPWYAARTSRGGVWGWHWTMNHYDPERFVKGKGLRREAASHYYPLIGLYDSGDDDLLQCHVLLMKLAGIDGVIVDWYGNEDFLDYGLLNRNTERLIPFLEQAGLRFAICYEDQSVKRQIEAGRFPASEAVTRGQSLMRWMEKRFFSSSAYLHLDKRPVLLAFGSLYYNDEQWNQLFSVLSKKPLFFTESDRRAATAAIGGFDWVLPRGGDEKAFQEQDSFYRRAKDWPHYIAAAFPRFHDIYVEAGVHASWGRIKDRDGRTYSNTLMKALQARAPVVQLVTWNDWGEGTQIEPSVEFGYRDLETTQRLRRKHQGTSFAWAPRDLRLPVEWYLRRKHYADQPGPYRQLAVFFSLVASGRLEQARALLARFPLKTPTTLHPPSVER